MISEQPTELAELGRLVLAERGRDGLQPGAKNLIIKGDPPDAGGARWAALVQS